jgi:hypothetical protein
VWHHGSGRDDQSGVLLLEDEEDRQIAARVGSSESQIEVLTFTVALLHEPVMKWPVGQGLDYLVLLDSVLDLELLDDIFQPDEILDPQSYLLVSAIGIWPPRSSRQDSIDTPGVADTRSSPSAKRSGSRTESPGLIIAPQKLPVAVAIEELLLIWALSEPSEWTNRICALPL